MPPILRILLGVLLLTAVRVAAAASSEAPQPLTLASTSRVYITLVPRTADDDFGPRWVGGAPAVQPALNLSWRITRRNRLDFSLSQRDVLGRGDQLKLRLASDAHVFAQLLSGGQFSEADDSWIAVLGLASRVQLSYTNGPLEFSVSAKHRLGNNDVRARLSLGVRF